MKYIGLILLSLFLVSCSTVKVEKTEDAKFERFFSIRGLTDMKAFDHLGSKEAPFTAEIVKKIQEKEEWREDLRRAWPEGCWVRDGEKLTLIK